MKSERVVVRRALIGVSDKAGLADFARVLSRHGVEIVSTGGTAAALEAAGVKVRTVENFTGLPEMLDGRVKTLHPKIHGGILARRDLATHSEQLAEHAIVRIDLVVVNLYPFQHTAAYDAAVARWLAEQSTGEEPGVAFPNRLHLDLDRIMELRYGENPH